MTRYRYTDAEIKAITKEMVILHDSREQKNEHILQTFETMRVKHERHTLQTGDYSVLLPALPGYGIMRPLYFDRDIIIERKGSLEELSGNLHKYKTDLSEKSFFATLLTFQQRYNLNTTFICKQRSGALIYSILYYHVRNWLIGGNN